ncbi:hypothetical protein [Nostoc sp. CCY0012]|uniref:hypothetical protein n=1 Tax=Nostoc sp. CCY0012 TaxID=1056123 RepID=UPI0039C6C957
MIDDILRSCEEWFIDEFNSDDILSPEKMDMQTESLLSYSDEVILDTSDSSVENISIEELSAFNIVDVFHQLLDWVIPDNQWDVGEFDGFGNPVENSQFWQQQRGQSSCAVVAQTSVFESITGICIPEEKACEIAQENGWFDPEIGTRPSDVGKLLNELGVPTEQKYNANLEDIADALEKGDSVIVGLDANEIWNPMRDANSAPIEQTNAGHAVWVTGINTQADGSVKIILNDSGNPNGKMASVDALDFLNAWEDYSNFLVVADAPEQTISA